MISDVIVIKDGIPLFRKNFSSTENVFSHTNNAILLSGFFSALNSFSDLFNSLGSIKELKLSNTDLCLSFLRDKKIPNLLFLAIYDDYSNIFNVQKTLKKISKAFLKLYGLNRITHWCGNIDEFSSFEDIASQFILENNELDLFRENYIDSSKETLTILKSGKTERKKPPDYYNLVPVFKFSKKVNPQYYLTGKTSSIVFEQINGKKSIEKIATDLNINHEQVFNICKSLSKMGFISLD